MIAEIGLLRHFGDRAMRRIAIVSLLFLQGCSSTDVEIPPVVMPTVVSPTRNLPRLSALKKLPTTRSWWAPWRSPQFEKHRRQGPGNTNYASKELTRKPELVPTPSFSTMTPTSATRSSVILDECDTETFTSFGTGPFSVQRDKPKPG